MTTVLVPDDHCRSAVRTTTPRPPRQQRQELVQRVGAGAWRQGNTKYMVASEIDLQGMQDRQAGKPGSNFHQPEDTKDMQGEQLGFQG